MSGSSVELWHCTPGLALRLEQMMDKVISLQVIVDLQYGSALSLLLFAVVIDVVLLGKKRSTLRVVC